MRNTLKNAAAMFGGSCVVYFIVAACGSEPGGSPVELAGSDAAAGRSAGGSPGVSGSPGNGGAAVEPMGGSSGTPALPTDGGIVATLRDAVADAGEALDAVMGAADAAGDAIADPVPNALASGYENGSRLRMRVLAGSDGAKQFVGWRDSELGVDCVQGTAADGATRCLPAQRMLTVFSDAACSVRVGYVVDVGCAPDVPQHASWTEQLACEPVRHHVAPVGSVIVAPPSVYRDFGGAVGCDTVDPCGGVVCTWYSLGAESAADDFVEFTSQTE